MTRATHLPFEETPGAGLIRRMKAAGFTPTGARDAFRLEFVGDLPTPNGEDALRLQARIRFERHADGTLPPWPSGVVVTTHRHLPLNVNQIRAALEEEPAACTALLQALDPYLTAVPPVPPGPAARPCTICGLKVSSWVVTREGDTTCLQCAVNRTDHIRDSSGGG